MGDRWAGVCVGVGRHGDPVLGELAQAVETARDVAKALDAMGSLRVVTNPPGHMDLFVALQNAMHEARGGSFFLYFAGFVFERDGQLLLGTTGTEARPKTGCVPWADVEDILTREKVARALVVLNAEKGAAFPPAAIAGSLKHPATTIVGSIRARVANDEGGSMRTYADALLKTLKLAPAELEPYLNAGKLDGEGLARALAERAPKDLGHATFHAAAEAVVVRDVARELERTPLSLRVPPKGAEPVAKEAVAETTAPVVETTAPAAETTAPAAETTAPAAETTAPVVESAAPVVESAAPAAQSAAPVVESAAPIVESAAPVVESAAPVVESAAPVVEADAPAPEPMRVPAPLPAPAPSRAGLYVVLALVAIAILVFFLSRR